MRMLVPAVGLATALALSSLAIAARTAGAPEKPADPAAGGRADPVHRTDGHHSTGTTAPTPATGSGGGAAADDPDSGTELIGRPAPEWSFARWIRTPPLSLEGLRGRVVLLRWWTEGCHFCAATLPELERIRTLHERDGLVVIGVFHPKPPREVSDRHVLGVAKRLHYDGPIAVDTRWRTLERYWLDGHPERSWTSVSFLVGRDGALKWVHGGGEYHPSRDPRHARCDLEFRDFERALAAALAEPAPSRLP